MEIHTHKNAAVSVNEEACRVDAEPDSTLSRAIPGSSHACGEESTEIFCAETSTAISPSEQATHFFHASQQLISKPLKNASMIIGGYEILGELGRGGMGVVYKAYQQGLERVVALKMVLAGAHASDEELRRFIIEAKAVAHLQHPNIVQVFDIGESNGLPYFSLEFVDGPSLSRHLSKQPQPPKDAAQMLETLSLAMAYAHEHSVLHRDLKPGNILLTLSGIPKIADFGLAKKIEDARGSGSTRTGTVMGTPSYMAPEQARGEVHSLGPAADQYSLGAILYEMLTGRPPFAAVNSLETIMQVLRSDPIPPRQLVNRIPVDLETICLKSLQKDISSRYENCKELAADLRRFLRGEPILARPVSRFERSWRWCRRNPIVASLGATAIGLLFAVAIGSSWIAATVTAKNVALAKQTRIANEKAAEADRQTAESIRRSDRMKNYIQGSLTDISKVNIFDNPTMRPFVMSTFQQMLPVLEEIIRELPETDQAEPTRAKILLDTAKALRQQGDYAAAESTLRDLVSFGERRLEVKGNSDAARINLSKFLVELASLRLETNRNFAEHLALLRRAESLAQDSIDTPRASPDDNKGTLTLCFKRHQLAETQNRLASAYYRLGAPRVARELFDSSTRKHREVVEEVSSLLPIQPSAEKSSTEVDMQKLMKESKSAINTNTVASSAVLFRTGQPEKAIKILQQVVAVTRKVHLDDPTIPSNAVQYIGFLGLLSEFEAQNGDPQNVLIQFEEACRLADQVYERDAQNAEKRRTAAVAHYRLGQWRNALGIAGEETSFARCFALRTEAAQLDATNDRKQLDLMLASAAIGDSSKCLPIAEKYLMYPFLDNEMRIDIARAYSQLSKSSPGAEQVARRSKAVDIVQAAVAAGFEDHVFLTHEIDLRPLMKSEVFNETVEMLRP